MKRRVVRALVALLLAISAGAFGYTAGGNTGSDPHIKAQTVLAPAPGSVRVIYSLDQKQNDKEMIALIGAAKEYIYFAIYTFTLSDVADALVAAKQRGVTVLGVIDSGQAASSYGTPIIEKLLAADIPIVVESHASGGGIMHIKALVTESAYAHGSYNWTSSATTLNDELLEIGTDPTLRGVYENVLKKLYEAYKGNGAGEVLSTPKSVGVIDYMKAGDHVGEYTSVRGVLIEAYTSKSGTVFLDFCKEYKSCPFTAVIFADDAKKFGDLSRYNGNTITLTGKISLYQGKAEIVLSDPSQISK